MLKYIRRSFAIILAILLISCACIVCSAAGTTYTITELDKMNVTLPETMSAVTRSSEKNDRYFSAFGLNYENVMQNFKAANIYLQGMNTDTSLSVSVTMTKSSETEGITNYNLLTKEKLAGVQANFLIQPEYISCTPDESNDKQVVWLLFNTKVSANGKDIYAYQAHTIYDGMSINVTLQRNAGNVSASDFNIFSNIVSSVYFEKNNQYDYLLPIVLIGGGVILFILLVILILAIRRSSKKNKSKKNEKILSELSDKYSTRNRSADGKNEKAKRKKSKINGRKSSEPEDVKGKKNIKNKFADNHNKKIRRKKSEKAKEDSAEIADNNVKSDTLDKKNFVDISSSKEEPESSKYIDTSMFEENLEQQFREDYLSDNNSDVKKVYVKNEPADGATDAEIDEIISNAHSFEINPDNIVYSEAQDVSRRRFEKIAAIRPEEKTADNAEQPDNVKSQASAGDETEILNGEEFNNDGITEDEDTSSEEKLIREEADKAKFVDSYDFFEEAPIKTIEVLNKEEINEAEDFDVITEVEKKATLLETEPDAEDPDEGMPIGERMMKIGAGFKYFFVHCGYFVQNLCRIVKRKRNKAKHKKAEEERRQLAIQNAERRKRQRAAEENGTLVRVHSRTDRRSAQGKSTRSGNRKSNTSRSRSSKNTRPTKK